jgi:tetratricopeptide (TPR) repeat protein
VSLRRLVLLAALGLVPGCGEGPAPAVALDDGPLALPLERLEPVVREQLEAAVARAESEAADDLAHLGMLSYGYGFPEHAVTWLRQALAVSGGDPRWSHALGLALDELGRPAEAATAFEAVLRARPDNAPARLRLAGVNLERGRVREALEQFESVGSTGGANEAHARTGAGRALVRLGQPARGRVQLEAALAIAPGHAPARYALATLLRDEGLLDQSAFHFQRARDDRDRGPPIDDPVARRIDELAIGATTALQRGMQLRRRSADYEAAATLFEEAVRLDPGLSAAHAELGAARMALGELARAQASLREALRLDPESANALYNLAWIAHREGRIEDALGGFRAAAAIRPHDFDALLGLGVAALGAGALEEGLSAMQRAIAARPADARPYRHLDTHYSDSGQEAKAIAVLKRGRRALPDDASLMMRLAWHLATTAEATRREPERALELARTVARSTDHPRALDTLAAALAANGLFHDAAELARRAAAGAEAEGNAELARAIRTRGLRYESGRAPRTISGGNRYP